jgi:AcrR family transcriptional regulator
MEIRDKLLAAALRLFEEAGSRGATTRRIATEAGVNEITLFRHFGSKQALIHEALQTAAHRGLVLELPETPVDPERELTEWCREHLAHLHQIRSLIRTCMGEIEERPEMRSWAGSTPRSLAQKLNGYLLRLRAHGLTDEDFDVGAASAMLMGALFTDAMGRDIMPERYDYSPEEAPAKYVRLLLRAVGVLDRPPGVRSHAADSAEER